MGRVIIDENSIYEIDEDCLRSIRPSGECGLGQALSKEAGNRGERILQERRQRRREKGEA